MSRYVNEILSVAVLARAGGRCEYCRISIKDTYFGAEIDHIISLKHGGKTDESNLALACQPCNRYKGPDIGSLSGSQELVRFYNPRTDIWDGHFRVNSEGEIVALTAVGEVTARIFRFNDYERVAERSALLQLDGNWSG